MNPTSNPTPPETRLAELCLELPTAPKPVAVYKPLIVVGALAHVSGHRPVKTDKSFVTGRVDADLDLDAGKAAARQAGLAMLSTLRSELGSLDRVKRDKANLDIFWLKHDSLEESANLLAPGVIAVEIAEDLEAALEQFATIAGDLMTPGA